MTVIIGLLGGKGVGKSTAASYLQKRYGAGVYAIADTIKDMLRTGFQLTEDQLHGTQAQKEEIDPRYNLSPRQLMQRQGDAIGRTFGDNFLIERIFVKIYKDKPRLAILSDVRYLHESDYLWFWGTQHKQHRSFQWRLHPTSELKNSISHRSEEEWALPEVDLEITPGIGVEELHRSIDKACEMSGLSQLALRSTV